MRKGHQNQHSERTPNPRSAARDAAHEPASPCYPPWPLPVAAYEFAWTVAALMNAATAADGPAAPPGLEGVLAMGPRQTLPSVMLRPPPPAPPERVLASVQLAHDLHSGELLQTVLARLVLEAAVAAHRAESGAAASARGGRGGGGGAARDAAWTRIVNAMPFPKHVAALSLPGAAPALEMEEGGLAPARRRLQVWKNVFQLFSLFTGGLVVSGERQRLILAGDRGEMAELLMQGANACAAPRNDCYNLESRSSRQSAAGCGDGSAVVVDPSVLIRTSSRPLLDPPGSPPAAGADVALQPLLMGTAAAMARGDSDTCDGNLDSRKEDKEKEDEDEEEGQGLVKAEESVDDETPAQHTQHWLEPIDTPAAEPTLGGLRRRDLLAPLANQVAHQAVLNQQLLLQLELMPQLHALVMQQHWTKLISEQQQQRQQKEEEEEEQRQRQRQQQQQRSREVERRNTGDGPGIVPCHPLSHGCAESHKGATPTRRLNDFWTASPLKAKKVQQRRAPLPSDETLDTLAGVAQEDPAPPLPSPPANERQRSIPSAALAGAAAAAPEPIAASVDLQEDEEQQQQQQEQQCPAQRKPVPAHFPRIAQVSKETPEQLRRAATAVARILEPPTVMDYIRIRRGLHRTPGGGIGAVHHGGLAGIAASVVPQAFAHLLASADENTPAAATNVVVSKLEQHHIEAVNDRTSNEAHQSRTSRAALVAEMWEARRLGSGEAAGCRPQGQQPKAGSYAINKLVVLPPVEYLSQLHCVLAAHDREIESVQSHICRIVGGFMLWRASCALVASLRRRCEVFGRIRRARGSGGAEGGRTGAAGGVAPPPQVLAHFARPSGTALPICAADEMVLPTPRSSIGSCTPVVAPAPQSAENPSVAPFIPLPEQSAALRLLQAFFRMRLFLKHTSTRKQREGGMRMGKQGGDEATDCPRCEPIMKAFSDRVRFISQQQKEPLEGGPTHVTECDIERYTAWLCDACRPQLCLPTELRSCASTRHDHWLQRREELRWRQRHCRLRGHRRRQQEHDTTSACNDERARASSGTSSADELRNDEGDSRARHEERRRRRAIFDAAIDVQAMLRWRRAQLVARSRWSRLLRYVARNKTRLARIITLQRRFRFIQHFRRLKQLQQELCNSLACDIGCAPVLSALQLRLRSSRVRTFRSDTRAAGADDGAAFAVPPCTITNRELRGFQRCLRSGCLACREVHLPALLAAEQRRMRAVVFIQLWLSWRLRRRQRRASACTADARAVASCAPLNSRGWMCADDTGSRPIAHTRPLLPRAPHRCRRARCGVLLTALAERMAHTPLLLPARPTKSNSGSNDESSNYISRVPWIGREADDQRSGISGVGRVCRPQLGKDQQWGEELLRSGSWTALCSLFPTFTAHMCRNSARCIAYAAAIAAFAQRVLRSARFLQQRWRWLRLLRFGLLVNVELARLVGTFRARAGRAAGGAVATLGSPHPDRDPSAVATDVSLSSVEKRFVFAQWWERLSGEEAKDGHVEKDGKGGEVVLLSRPGSLHHLRRARRECYRDYVLWCLGDRRQHPHLPPHDDNHRAAATAAVTATSTSAFLASRESVHCLSLGVCTRCAPFVFDLFVRLWVRAFSISEMRVESFVAAHICPSCTAPALAKTINAFMTRRRRLWLLRDRLRWLAHWRRCGGAGSGQHHPPPAALVGLRRCSRCGPIMRGLHERVEALQSSGTTPRAALLQPFVDLLCSGCRAVGERCVSSCAAAAAAARNRHSVPHPQSSFIQQQGSAAGAVRLLQCRARLRGLLAAARRRAHYDPLASLRVAERLLSSLHVVAEGTVDFPRDGCSGCRCAALCIAVFASLLELVGSTHLVRKKDMVARPWSLEPSARCLGDQTLFRAVACLRRLCRHHASLAGPQVQQLRRVISAAKFIAARTTWLWRFRAAVSSALHRSLAVVRARGGCVRCRPILVAMRDRLLARGLRDSRFLFHRGGVAAADLHIVAPGSSSGCGGDDDDDDAAAVGGENDAVLRRSVAGHFPPLLCGRCAAIGEAMLRNGV